MKSTPMPLFNYRKRERHAIVSEPQKNQTTNGSPANNSMQKTDTNTSKFTAGNFDSSISPKYSSSPFSNSKFPVNSKPPHSIGSTKAVSSFSKAPPLINHKAGAINRRTSTTPAPSPNNSSFGPSRFQSGNSNTFGLNNSNSRNFSVNKSQNNVNPRIVNSNMRGRGRGGLSSFHNSITNNEDLCEDGNASNLNYFPSGRGRATNERGRGIIGRGRATNERGRGINERGRATNVNSTNNQSFNRNSSGGNSSLIPQYLNNRAESSMQSWSNDSSRGSFNQNVSDTALNKPKVVKLQSGNVQAQFGIHRNKSQINKRGGLSRSNSFESRECSSNGQTSGVSSLIGSIFDEEDVAMQPNKCQKTSPQSVDTSLRIFTCPISDIQSWSEARLYPGTVMFEIFGLIISGPTDTHSGVGKEFYLRDQSATIRCVFYEIDRELPPIVRGHVHRVVGSMKHEGMNSFMKIVSLRKADKIERVSCQQSTQLSLNEMDKWARRFDKEQ